MIQYLHIRNESVCMQKPLLVLLIVFISIMKADKNIKDNSGKTALDYARERKLKNLERLLS